MFLQRPGWHISNASDINGKKVCLSFLIVFLNTPNGAAQSMSQYEFLMRTLGTSRLLRAQRAGLPALHCIGGSVGLWGQGASQREESGRCVSLLFGGLLLIAGLGEGVGRLNLATAFLGASLPFPGSLVS